MINKNGFTFQDIEALLLYIDTYGLEGLPVGDVELIVDALTFYKDMNYTDASIR